MSAQKRSAKRSAHGALGAFAGFVGMSVVAGLLVTAAVTPAIAVTGIAASDSLGMFENLPEYLKLDQLPQVSTVYAKKGNTEVQIASFWAQNRVVAKWGDISQFAKDAATSGEDPRFYEHGGIDIKGTVRGALSTWLKKDTQGGSTITQQYVKNVKIQMCEKYNVNNGDEKLHQKWIACYNDATETTPDRKLKEMKQAIGLEKKYGKNTILLNYLNIAGFGGQVYGIQSASLYYYGVSAKDLTVAQAASLLAIVNNPDNLRLDVPDSKTNGAKNGYAANKSRRDYIIDKMLQYKKITQKQRDEAIATKITPKITPQSNGCMTAAAYDADIFCSYVQNSILNDPAFGATADDRWAALTGGGFKIYTTLDLDLQKTTQDSLRDYVPATAEGMDIGGATVALQQNTGRILTMAQNRPYNNTAKAPAGTTSLNYTADAAYGDSGGFAVGSTYKAFSLVAWLQEGHALRDIINADRHTYPTSLFHNSCAGPDATWNVSNDEGGEGGNMSVLDATKYSVNTAFATMGTKVDLCTIQKAATALGMHESNGDPMPSNASSILGSGMDISPLTLATAYAGFANGGKICTPVAIDKVTNADGTDRPVTPTSCKQAIDPKIAAGVAYALQTPFQGGGTAQSANPRDGVPLLGKTGTTDGAYDNWLATATTKVATATWIGNVQGVKQANGKYEKTDMHYKYFQPKSGGYYRQGNNLKFPVVKTILEATNAKFGGSAFPTVDSLVLNGIQVDVPDVAGKSLSDAKSLLTGVGFTVQEGGRIAGSQPSGTMERSDPAGGTKASKGATILLYASDGTLVTVPGLSGTKADIQATLNGAGFNSVKFTGSNDPDATFKSSSPAPGSQASTKSTITVTLQAPAKTGPNPPKPGNG